MAELRAEMTETIEGEDWGPMLRARITTGQNFGDWRILIDHDPDEQAIGVMVIGMARNFVAGETVVLSYGGGAAEFMAALGFLPDPGCAGTWYESGAATLVPDWIEVFAGGLKIKRGDPEYYAEMRHLFMTGKLRP